MDKRGPRIISVTIQKGGTGKTTTAQGLAQAAVYRGLNVLAIDLDPQGNFSFSLSASTTGAGSLDFLEGRLATRDIIQKRQGLDVIPAQWALSTVTSSRGSARRLQRAIYRLFDDYDLIVIDSPASGELQYNALQAATDLVIPLQADIYNLQSLYQTIDTARHIQETNPGLTISGVLFTCYSGRTNLAKQMRATMEEKAGAAGVPCLGHVRQGVAIQEAAALQTSLYKYAPKSKPAQDYLKILDILLAQDTQVN